MAVRAHGWWPAAAVALALTAATAAVVLEVAGGRGAGLTPPMGHNVVFCLWGVVYAGVGGLITARRPGNAVGTLLLAAGLVFALCSAAFAYADLALGPDGWAGGAEALWVADTVSIVALGCIPVALLVFPDGAAPGRRWRLVGWACAAAVAALVAGVGLTPGGLDAASPAPNPLGIGGLATPLLALQVAGWALTIAGFGGAGAAVVVRLRRSTGVARLQVMWVAYAAAVLGAVWAVWTATYALAGGVVHEVALACAATAMAGIPAAMGVAILRHRLYGIDVIVRRTLVYGLLVAVLSAAYLGGVAVSSLAIGSIAGGGGSAAITVATLAVAGMAQPLRRRIQRGVDRRFYRGRYDAGRITDHFSHRAREIVDIDAMHAELLTVVRRTLQPSQASLWLADPAQASRTGSAPPPS